MRDEIEVLKEQWRKAKSMTSIDLNGHSWHCSTRIHINFKSYQCPICRRHQALNTLGKEDNNMTPEEIIAGLLDTNDEDTVKQLIDDLIPEYLSDGWEDEFDDQFEAYAEQGRGEAESQILRDLLTYFMNENHPNGATLSDDAHCQIIDAMKDAWSID